MSLTTNASAQRVGAALRAARRSSGLRRRDAATRAGLSTSELRGYERGAASAPEDVVDRLADEYGCDAGSLLPGRAVVTLEPGRLRVGDVSKTLRSQDPQPDEVLKGYLGLLYGLRSKKPGTRIPLRDHDLDALAEALGGTSDAIEERLIELMHVSRDEAAAMTATLLRRRLIVPAAGLVFGAGLLTGGMKLADQHGTQARATATSIGAAASVARDDPALATAIHVERVGEGVTVPDAVTAESRGDVTAPPEAVLPPTAEVTSPTVVTAPAVRITAPVLVTTPVLATTPAEVIAPAVFVVEPIAETIVVVAPSDEVVAPADDVVVAPSEDQAVAPDEVVTESPADDAAVPVEGDATLPDDDTVVPPDGGQDATAPECPPEVLLQANQSRLRQIRDTDFASETDPANDQANEPQVVLQLLRGDDPAPDAEGALEQPSNRPNQQRLSTGLRINRAADDPAGLSVTQGQGDDECDPAEQRSQDADSELEQANQAPQVILQLLR